MIEYSKIADTYLIVVEEAALPFIALLALALGIGLAWLANRPQPTPHADHWEWIDGRTDWKKTVR